MPQDDTPPPTPTPPPHWPASMAWTLAWIAMIALDGRLDLANQALILVLACAVAAIWWGPWLSMAAAAAAVLAFNFAFVPPRGTFSVDLHQHALLLLTMLAVSWIVALLMARLRALALDAYGHAQRSDQLRRLGDALRESDDAVAQAPQLAQALSRLGGSGATLMLAAAPEAEARTVGPVNADERAGLGLCQREGKALGPGTGRHEEQPAWYLPLRGRSGSFGAALLRLSPNAEPSASVRGHAQALCDQFGSALERLAATRAAAAAQESARAQALRNTLLAAIAHDHRTPLATIAGAAGSLHDQDERLSPEQRRRLAATILDEATQLARLTDNTLQLARLGALGELQRDWESVEELAGTVLRRLRQRMPSAKVKARVEPGLPLLRCDAVLMVQLLDNLVDNALKHGGAEVEVAACRHAGEIVLAVRDRGPGVPAAERERIFDTFQRGEALAPAGAAAPRRGAGIGLALCRAIARAHGGELRLRPRRHGGSSFELVLPVEAAPAQPEDGVP